MKYEGAGVRSRPLPRTQHRRSVGGYQPVPNRAARIAVQWMSSCGLNNPEIEKRLGLDHKFVWTWAKRTSAETLPGRGRKKLISKATGLAMKRSIVKVRFKTARSCLSLAPCNPALGKKVSTRTINRALHDAGAISVRVRKSMKLPGGSKATRLAWCQEHEEKGTDFAKWNFSDEKWWRVGGTKGNERIWVCSEDPDPDERYIPQPAHPAKVMIWGAISYHGKSSIHFFDASVNSETYEKCIEEAYLPSCFDSEYLAMSKSEQYVFQQDGARAHTSKRAQEWLQQNLPENVKLLKKDEWPPYSPDLSPIERLWAILQDKVVEEEAWTQEKLIACVEKWWWKIDQSTIQKLFDSMPTRLGKCIGAEGGRFRL
jgi:transposase